MWSVDYAYAFTHADAWPVSVLGFFRNSDQGPPSSRAISYELHSKQCLSLLSLAALLGVLLPAQAVLLLLKLLQKIGSQNVKP